MIPQDEMLEAANAVTRGDPGGELLLRSLCERHPEDARVHFFLGALLERLGRDEAAVGALQRALALDPDHVQALSAMAAVLSRLGRNAQAHSLLLSALERLPENAQLCTNLGAIRIAMGDLTGALSSFDRALALPDPPAAAYMNRGYALIRLGRGNEALENNTRAGLRFPQNADMQFNVAEVLMSLYRPADALAACDRALDIDPAHANAMIVRGLALAQLERFGEAQSAFDRVRTGNPEAILNFVNTFETGRSDDLDRFDPELIFLSSAYHGLHDCDWSQRNALIARLMNVVRDRVSSPGGLAEPGLAYNALTLPLPDSMRLGIARGLARRLEFLAGTARVGAWPSALAGAKIRIGYLSPDFREHLNAYLLRPLLQLHDRSRFEVICYSVGPPDRSAIRGRIEAAADKFVEASGLDDARIADLIRAEGIDVLVDVGGYTTYSRPGVPARRPAPVQVGYLAYPGTQAMSAVPWRIVDRIASPPAQKEAWTEALVFLPDTFFIYDASEPQSGAALSRRDYGLPDDAFVFCSFNNYYKIEPEIFGVWMEILRAVPSSVLWLAGRNAVAAANLRSEAESRGVSADRLVFAPFESRERYRARFRLANLFLDTPIFNAMTTACDALAAGLPLLTLPGTSFPSRVAASLLTAGGFTDGISESIDAYRTRAIAWGTCPETLDRLRREKLANPLATPLFDTGARVRQLEMAYQEMLRRFQAGLSPESFDVVARPANAWRSRWH